MKKLHSFKEVIEAYMSESTETPTSDDVLIPKEENLTPEHRINMANLRPSWPDYISGYKDGADILVERLEEGGTGHDVLVYPIMFLYRQYLELAVKGLIWRTGNTYRACHEICKNWETCQAYLLKEIPELTDQEKDSITEVTRLIKEFVAIDKQSTTFRYPDEILKNPSRVPKGIPLTHIRDVVNKIWNLLDSMDAYLVERWQIY